jgi:hypothetical protein
MGTKPNISLFPLSCTISETRISESNSWCSLQQYVQDYGINRHSYLRMSLKNITCKLLANCTQYIYVGKTLVLFLFIYVNSLSMQEKEGHVFKQSRFARVLLIQHNLPKNFGVEWLTFLRRIWKVPGSNIGPETGYTDWGFRDYPQSL